MPTFGLIVEGHYDVVALSEIIKNSLSDEPTIIPRTLGSRLMKKFPGHLEEFRWVNQGSPCDKAFVIRDADKKDVNELKGRMLSKIANRNYPFEVKIIVIVNELETWLLADERAISKATKRNVSKVGGNLETTCKSKELLISILSRAKVAYTSEIAREIAKHSNPNVIESRCPGFECFKNAIADC